jgi:hypothetical protein
MRSTGVRGILIYLLGLQVQPPSRSGEIDGLITSGFPILSRASFAKHAGREAPM